MPITPDDATGEVSNLAFGLDNHNLTAGDPSIFEAAANVVTKGIPLTGLAVANSFANTAIDIGNWFGADNKRISIQDEVGDGEYNDYYQAHSQGIETAALIGGSLIPGTAAIKALKLAQAGEATAALTRATNLFAGPKAAIIKNAMEEITDKGAFYNALNVDKFKAIALGAGDQTLQALAYEAATAATMHASPLLDGDGLKDTLENMTFGALTGGAIGGVIEGIGVRAIFNKALLFADKSAKTQELANYVGNANYTVFNPGDRIVELIKSIDDIPAPTTALQSKRFADTRNAAIDNAKLALQTIVPQDQGDVANATFDALMRMKQVGEVGPTPEAAREDYYNRLNRLVRITRSTDLPPVNNPDSSVFYVRSIAPGDGAGFGDVVTNIPAHNYDPLTANDEAAVKAALTGKPDFELGYRLRAGETDVKIARVSTGAPRAVVEEPYFTSKSAAFDGGYDMFIDKNLRVQVNPDAPHIERVARPGESRPLTPKEELLYRTTGKLPANSSALTGASTVLNTITGDTSNSAVPVIGDFGKVALSDVGVRYGDNTSLQSLATPLTAATPTVDANARYVWASLRGIKVGDVIGTQDIPMLEQLYREAAANKAGFANYAGEVAPRMKVALSDATPLPRDAAGWQDLLRQSKESLIGDVMRANPKMGSEEVARRANVTEDFIANGFKADKPADYLVPPEQSAVVNHVRLHYDLGNINQQDGNILRGSVDAQYRVSQIQDALKVAANRFWGKRADQMAIEGNASDAVVTGVGPKFLAASQAAYNSLGQEAERVGRALVDYTKSRVEVLHAALTQPAMMLRLDPVADQEVRTFVAVRRRSSENYVPLPQQLAQKYNLIGQYETGTANVAVIESSLIRDRSGAIVDWNPAHTPDGFINGGAGGSRIELSGLDPAEVGLRTAYRVSDKLATWENANMQLNDWRIQHANNFQMAIGKRPSYTTGTWYAPPLDTTKYPYIALVKPREGLGGNDGSVSAIVAENAQELGNKIAQINRDHFDVWTKSDLKKYHEVEGDFDYNLNFANVMAKNELQRKGILNNIVPDGNIESTIKDYIDWHTRQETRLGRNYVELSNAPLFAQLKEMGERYSSLETGKVGFVPALFGRTAPNPYGSYIKTATNVSERDEYRLWHDSQEKLESYFSSAFRTAKQAFAGASQGKMSYEDATAEMGRMGLGNPYDAFTKPLLAYADNAAKLPPARYLQSFISTANAALGATVIKLDTFQQIIHAVSSPMLALVELQSIKTNEAAMRAFTTELPDGSGRSVITPMKFLFRSMADFRDADVHAKYDDIYRTAGAARIPEAEYYQKLDELTLPYGRFSGEGGLAHKLSNIVEYGQKFAGTNLSESFTNWIAANSARLAFEALGYTGKQLTDNIGSFVNRVKGNIIAAQRPVAFQGPLGQAIGLFQSYQFNLFQNLFRYVENGEAKTIGMMGALQTTLFGFNSLPGFQMINQHLVGNSANNPSHKDLYTANTSFFGKQLGDWLMYGSLSNVLNAGLYTRGDINPRQISLLPINPVDYPAIAGAIRFVGDLIDTGSRIAKGGNVADSLLIGLEHNGLSRPLQGLGALANGYSTTSKGSLLSSQLPVNPNIGDNTTALGELYNVIRTAGGARQLDTAVAFDQLYRNELYQAKDTARIESLGKAVKTTLYDNQAPSMDEVNNFASEYQSAGGRIQSFGKKMVEWTNDANASVANKVFRNLRNPLNARLQQLMGGQPLPDFQNQGSTAPASSAVPIP